ncbi:MAG TPA: thioredoxin domain-containing protein [Solirubrobacteraceae bacterium]|nr:thioredoxin domain-containing protein [Solirubrobacteraceae bacterium]
MPNALARETSPYLRQHAGNPVDWMPWGPEALQRASAEDRPLLVSIGYSSCHWCHVMERESFEDAQTAALMNERFVCVKVDREERPDIDAIYMEAVQSLTGHGGWPLNVFITPDQVPIYGGTYFPPEPRHGMPAWRDVLLAISESWRENREQIRAGTDRLRERLAGGASLQPSEQEIGEQGLEYAVKRLTEMYDARNGGFGGAPKFPQASAIEFLLLRGERAMSLASLHAMAGGGIRDVLAGGFARYAVDAAWTVPHFEKMLYDNALLARAYLHGWQASGDERLREVCESTLDWALGEMRGPEGGFYSALDADSEGVEGRYYTWTAAQLRELLGDDAAAAFAWFGCSESGNFPDLPGENVLQDRAAPEDPELRERIRSRLLAARAARARPGLDDKRLTSWNALLVSALADAGGALGREDYVQAALACAEFIEHDLRGEDGRLLRTYSHGEAKIAAYLEDHAFLLEAQIALFETGCEERWLDAAVSLADEIIARFGDPDRGGFFSTASDAEELLTRRKELEDSPIPAGASSAAMGLLRLSQLTGEDRYEQQALGAMRLVAEIAPRHPQAFGHMLQAMHWYLAPARPIACEVPRD